MSYSQHCQHLGISAYRRGTSFFPPKLRLIFVLVLLPLTTPLTTPLAHCQSVLTAPIPPTAGPLLSLPSPQKSMTKKRMTPERLWQLQRLGESALSPDGTKIAYTLGRYDLAKNEGKKSLVIIDIASQEELAKIENWTSISSLQWDASGEPQRIYFVGQKNSTQPNSTQPNSTQPNSTPLTATDNTDQLQPTATQPDDAQAIDDSGTATGENKTQVWRLNIGNRVTEQITTTAYGVSHLKLSPDGKRIAYTTDVKMLPEVRDLYADLPHADARIIDALMYRHWDTWKDYKFSHIHVANIPTEGQCDNGFDLMQGIEADCPVGPWGGDEQFAWSPAGNEIAFTMKNIPNGTQWAQSTNTDVYIVDVDALTEAKSGKKSGTNPSKKLGTANQPHPLNITAARDGYDRNPSYSPDGKWIAFSSMQRPGFEADRVRIMLFNRTSQSTHELTVGLDQNAHHALWARDSQSVFFDSEVQGTQQIFELPVQHRSPPATAPANQSIADPVAITSGRYHWSIVGQCDAPECVIVKRADMLRPDELFRLSTAAIHNVRENNDGNHRHITALTKINDDIYQTLELPTVEQHFVEATDGKQIHTWVIRPVGFDPGQSKRWPMLLYCQGGPQAQVGQNFSWRWNFHLMASQGYVVVAPNRRGLPGFGQQWNDQISGDWGGQAMRDLLSVTDHFSAQATIDSKRVAAVGASFGGYSIYWMMGHHENRFSAMIAHCGVFNLESMYGSTEELFFVNWDLGGPYWLSDQLQNRYRDFSPHQFVKNWETPLLVIHGQQDFRVPVTQGMEAFTAAQVRNVPSRFLYFPEESHWVTSPQNSVLWHRVFFDWLDRHGVR